MQKLFGLALALILGSQIFTTEAEAAIVNAPVDSSSYITINGMDWAWASPCGAENGCATLDMSYQSTHGWSVATTALIDSVIALAGGLQAWSDLFGNGSTCASQYFNTSYSHCDNADVLSGTIWNYSGAAGGNQSYSETFVVRAAVPAVPLPGALPLLGAGLAAFGALKRRKKAA